MTCLGGHQDNYVPVNVNRGALKVSLLVVQIILDVVLAVDESMRRGVEADNRAYGEHLQPQGKWRARTGVTYLGDCHSFTGLVTRWAISRCQGGWQGEPGLLLLHISLKQVSQRDLREAFKNVLAEFVR